MKRTAILVLIASLLLCLCACGNEKIKESDKSKNVIELVTKAYDSNELNEIASFEGSIYELNDKYNIECLRIVGEYYRVAYLGDGCVLIIYYTQSGQKLHANISQTPLTSGSYESIMVGDSIAKVMEFDPDAEYWFLYTGRTDFPRVSSHYTKDGYLITIEYDESNYVIEINKELI